MAAHDPHGDVHRLIGNTMSNVEHLNILMQNLLDSRDLEAYALLPQLSTHRFSSFLLSWLRSTEAIFHERDQRLLLRVHPWLQDAIHMDHGRTVQVGDR